MTLHPSPNRPGYWAYRVTPDGAALEIELSGEEWRELRQKEIAAQNAAVRQLNEHPLNQAALVLLRQAETGLHPVDALEGMHLLSLASLGLPDFDESAEAEEAGTKFSNWTWDVPSMRAALTTLEGALDPEELLDMSPREASEYVLGELGIV